MPIAVLIGTIYALARLAQSSRVHDPAHRRPRARAARCWLLASLALVFGVVTFVCRRLPRAAHRAHRAASCRRGYQRRPEARPLRRLAQGAREHGRRRAQLLDQRRLGRGAARTLQRRAHLRVRRRRPPPGAHLGRAGDRRSTDGDWTLRDVDRRRAGSSDRRRPRPSGQDKLADARWPSTPVARSGRGRGAAGHDDVDARPLALHRPPRRQRAGGADAADPVLEARALSRSPAS